MNIKDFKVGQKVFVKLVGNASRGKRGNELIEEWIIVSVGRKLIKAKPQYLPDVCAKTFEKSENADDEFVDRNECCVNYILYANREKIEEDLEIKKLLKSISTYFNGFGKKKISLENLRKIAELIEETESE